MGFLMSTLWNKADVLECAKYVNAAYNSEIEKIKANIEIGRIVAKIIESASYGDRAIVKFAAEVSSQRGKIVYPQRLYEAYRVYSTVKNIDKVLEIASKLSTEITWDWLVKNVTRNYENEKNKEVKDEIFEAAIKKVEATVEYIEKIAAHTALEPSKKQQLEGLAIALSDAAKSLLDMTNTNKQENNRKPTEITTKVEKLISYEEQVLECFVETDQSIGIFMYKDKWYAPRYGVETLKVLIDTLQTQACYGSSLQKCV